MFGILGAFIAIDRKIAAANTETKNVAWNKTNDVLRKNEGNGI